MVTTLLSAKATTGAGSSVKEGNRYKVFQATLSSTTTPTATVYVQGSLDGTNFVTLGTITLSGSAATDGFASDAPWKYFRGYVNAISGTSATVTLLMGV